MTAQVPEGAPLQPQGRPGSRRVMSDLHGPTRLAALEGIAAADFQSARGRGLECHPRSDEGALRPIVAVHRGHGRHIEP